MHTMSVAFRGVRPLRALRPSDQVGSKQRRRKNAKLKLRPENSPQFFSRHARREATETPPTTTTGKPGAGCSWLALIIST
jgi:hypothetical protein